MIFIKARLSATALALVAAFVMAPAAKASDTYGAGVGVRDDSCSLWLAARAASPTDPNAIAAHLMTSWVLGFLTGLNTTTNKDDMVRLLSADTINAYLDKACKEEPGTMVMFHAVALRGAVQRQDRR